MFAYGWQIFSLSRAGYFPRWLSVTHGRRQTPHHALWLGGAIGYAVAFAAFWPLLWFALGLAYFPLWGRHRVVKSPEEDFALRAARGGSPQ